MAQGLIIICITKRIRYRAYIPYSCVLTMSLDLRIELGLISRRIKSQEKTMKGKGWQGVMITTTEKRLEF